MLVDRKTVTRLLDVYDIALVDPEYRRLHGEYTVYQQKVLELYDWLEEEQLAALVDYLGVCAQMHLRLMALACTNDLRDDELTV